MKTPELHAFRTLVRIRMRRQEKLDKLRYEAQQELQRLEQLVGQAEKEKDEADHCVTTQIRKIDDLMQSGNQFQIADYLSQQDYLQTLESRARTVEANVEQAKAAVLEQQDVLQKSRTAAAENVRQRERLEERVRSILKIIEIKNMDEEDEEAEEAVVTRKLLKSSKALKESAMDGHG